MAIERSTKARGTTLTELVIYMGLAVLVMALIASMFTVAKRTQQHTYAQYLIGGRVASAMRVLKQDLSSTALSSIKVSPGSSGGAPGLSLASAYDSEGKFTLGDYGSPEWQKHVYYHLDKDGALIRWSSDNSNKNNLPTEATRRPSEVDSSGHVLTSGLLPANVEVEGFQQATPYGGFEVGFVRRKDGKDTVVPVNPKDSTDFESHTRLVDVKIRTLEGNGESNPTYSSMTIRVCPRY